MSSPAELLVNQRPIRTIKRRRLSDEDVMDEQNTLENSFDGGGGATLKVRPGASGDYGSAAAAKVPNRNPSGAIATSPAESDKMATTSLSSRAAAVVSAASVNVPVNKRPKSSSSKRQKNRVQFMNTIWRPEDDLLLIDAALQTSDLFAVFCAVKFSTHFTLREVQERWESLLYDCNISKTALDRIAKLPIDIRRRILTKALFSEPEEQILMDINSNNLPSLETFQSTLLKNKNIFHASRTAKSLRKHWLLLRRYQLLSSQGVNNQLNQEQFSDAEERIEESAAESMNKPQFNDPVILNEIDLASSRACEEIKVLETEIPRWQFLLTQTSAGHKMSDFDSQTFAILRGRSIRYFMKKRTITIGRTCKGNTVDVDLSLEGPAHKISRIQAIIKIIDSGVFVFQNQGKRPVFVDGRPVLPGSKRKLFDNSVIIICKLALLLLTNGNLISKLQDSFNEKILQSAAAAASTQRGEEAPKRTAVESNSRNEIGNEITKNVNP